MMHRCYGKVYKRVQSYINCVVDSRWHNFQQFCEDIKELDGYSEWLNPENKMCLDKDTKVPGNGSYGPSTCVFLTKSANVKAKKRKTVSKAFQ